MSQLSSQPGRHMLDGTIRLFLAEALLLPTGIITAAFLARELSPAGYGLFTLAATIVAWIEWSLTSAFSRAVIKFIGEADDWRPVGSTVLRLYLATGIAAAILLWLVADVIAAPFNEPMLAHYLRLFAVDIPLFTATQAHRSILIGRGGFKQQSLASASRWVSRLLLIILFVELGLSITGTILGCIGASLVELAASRYYARPSIFRHTDFPARRLWGYAAPLFLSALSLRIFDKVDLLMLMALGGTAADAGIYGAAQNLALVPSLFALSFSPLLLSTLSRIQRTGDASAARRLSRDAMRVVVLLLPFAGMTVGVAPEIVAVIFGPAFLPSSPLLAMLIFSSLALVMISVATVVLIAAGKPGWTFTLTAPLPLLALAGHLWLIPRLGSTGAALVTLLVATAGAVVAVAAVYHHLRIVPPAATLWRSALVGGLAYALSIAWPVSGSLLLLKLPVIALMVPLAFMLLGEFSSREIALARSMLRRSTPPAATGTTEAA